MMKKYFLAISISLQNIFAHRFRAFVWILSDVVTLVYAPFIWLAAFGANDRIGDLSRGDMVTYFLLITIVSLLVYSHASQYINDDIFTGSLTKNIVKPYSYLLYSFFSESGSKIINVVVGIIIYVLGTIFFPEYIYPPEHGIQILWFFVFVLFARILSFLVESVIGLSAFWLERTWSLRGFYFLADQIIGGRLVPLPLFSRSIQQLISFLPFSYILAVPVEVYMGRITGIDLLYRLLIVCAWTTFFFILVCVLWSKGLRRYSGDGK